MVYDLEEIKELRFHARSWPFFSLLPEEGFKFLAY